jgi:hypothetical protein
LAFKQGFLCRYAEGWDTGAADEEYRQKVERAQRWGCLYKLNAIDSALESGWFQPFEPEV